MFKLWCFERILLIVCWRIDSCEFSVFDRVFGVIFGEILIFILGYFFVIDWVNIECFVMCFVCVLVFAFSLSVVLIMRLRCFFKVFIFKCMLLSLWFNMLCFCFIVVNFWLNVLFIFLSFFSDLVNSVFMFVNLRAFFEVIVLRWVINVLCFLWICCIEENIVLIWVIFFCVVCILVLSDEMWLVKLFVLFRFVLNVARSFIAWFFWIFSDLILFLNLWINLVCLVFNFCMCFNVFVYFVVLKILLNFFFSFALSSSG